MKYTSKVAILPYDRYERLQKKYSSAKEDSSHENTKINDQLLIDDMSNNDHVKNTENKYNVLDSLPENLRKKASLLLNYLDTLDTIKWNADGNVIINGKLIEGSHIVDLIRDAIVKTSSYYPIGINEFYSNLKNIPLTLITNKKRLKEVQNLKGAGSFKPNDDTVIEGINKSEPPGIPNKKEIALTDFLKDKHQFQIQWQTF